MPADWQVREMMLLAALVIVVGAHEMERRRAGGRIERSPLWILAGILGIFWIALFLSRTS